MDIIELKKPAILIEKYTDVFGEKKGGHEKQITTMYRNVTEHKKIRCKFFKEEKEIALTCGQQDILDAWISLAMNGCEVFTATQLYCCLHFFYADNARLLIPNQDPELDFEKEPRSRDVEKAVLDVIESMKSIDMEWLSVNDDGETASIKGRILPATTTVPENPKNTKYIQHSEIWCETIRQGHVSSHGDTSSTFTLDKDEWVQQEKRQLWTVFGDETTANKTRTLNQWTYEDEDTTQGIDSEILDIVGDFLFNKLQFREYPVDEKIYYFLTPAFTIDNYIKYKKLEKSGRVYSWTEDVMETEVNSKLITVADWERNLIANSIEIAGYIFDDPRNDNDYQECIKNGFIGCAIEHLVESIEHV